MATATQPTSIRLTSAEKRRIATAARKRGLSPAAYVKRLALEKSKPDDDRLNRLAAMIQVMQEAVENELDYRLAVTAWDRHEKSGARLLKPEEVWRELGI